MKWAITPRGIGKTVGIRAIEDDWPLVEGEVFTVDDWQPEMVLSDDQKSLRTATRPELDEVAKTPPLLEALEKRKISVTRPQRDGSVEGKLKTLGITLAELKDAVKG